MGGNRYIFMINENSQENSALFVGQILKSSRIEQGLSLEAISKKLRISKRQLVQLEEDHENLVCDVYTLGFLRSYSRCLGLDENDISQKFKDQASHPKSPHFSFPAPLPGKGRPSYRILGLCLLVLVTVIGGWRWFGSSPLTPTPQGTTNLAEFVQQKSEVKEPIPSDPPSPLQQVSASLKPEEAIDSSVVEPAAIEPVALEPIAVESVPLPSPPHPSTVLIKTTEEAWIEIKNKNGTIILSKLFAPNETFELNDSQNLIMKTGNARGTQLIFGDKTHILSDKPGEVKSNVLLDPQKWVEETPKTD